MYNSHDDAKNKAFEKTKGNLRGHRKYLESAYGKDTFDALIRAADSLGIEVRELELDRYTEYGDDVYELDQTKRDRLLVNCRQDVASIYGISSDALRIAIEAKSELRSRLIGLWFLILIQLGITIYLGWFGS